MARGHNPSLLTFIDNFAVLPSPMAVSFPPGVPLSASSPVPTAVIPLQPVSGSVCAARLCVHVCVCVCVFVCACLCV